MDRSRHINVICVTVFIGVLLSCAMFFGISAMMDADIGDGGTSAENDIFFSSFSNAFYDSGELQDKISRYGYLFFGSLDSRDIIMGDEDFLFDAGEYGGHYSYLEDFVGADPFSEVELEALANIINLRRVAYQNQGVEYLLVVIPNSQTVYSDYVPSYLGRIGTTRLDQLSEYAQERGYDCFLNTADVLKVARYYSKDILYNNTENSLNSLGEWYVYSAVCDKLDTLYGAKGTKVALNGLDLYVSYTDGKTLARRAGLSSIIQNKTVSLSNNSNINYTAENYYGSMVKTEKLNDHRIGGDCPVILMEFTDNWDRVQLMPYFSATYDEVAYKSNHQFSRLVTENLKPDIVVQFIREYELYDMIDAGLCLTYNAGLKLNSDPYITASPILIGSSQVSNNSICIAGETEFDAVISVSGEGIESVSQRAIGSLFFVEVEFEEGKRSALVKIFAKVKDKEESAPMSFSVTLSEDEREKTVAVGSNSQLYSTDYSTINFLSEEQTDAVRAGLVEQLAAIKAASGKDTEYIYVVVPDKLSIYSDDAPVSLRELVGTVEDYKEMVGNIAQSAGMTVIDLTDEMKAHNSLESTYCQTDMLWTGFGSYVGYHSLMSHISEKFSSVKPHGLGDLIAVAEKNVGGELVTRLGIDGAVISESYLTLTLDIDSDVHFEQSGDGNFDITQAFISYNDTNGKLPVAIVTRDAYGTGMLENMAEHFSKMVVLREGEFAIGDKLISEIKPDYIITIRCNGELS